MSILTLEEYTVRTWPCLESLIYDGWLLRFAEGFTGRSNAVYPLYRSTYDLAQKLAYCEEQYRLRGLPSRFKITIASQPPGLDSILESLGYAFSSASLTLTLALRDDILPDPQAVVVDAYSDAWVDAYLACNPGRANHREILCRLLRGQSERRLFATVQRDGQPVGAGMLVLTRGAAGLYNVATRSDMRGQGIGLAITQSLLAAAAARRVPLVFLQVEASNVAALRLYRGLGFETAFEYHYRLKDTGQA